MGYVSKILIVDDEIPVCKSIRFALECEQYLIDTVLSGEEALIKEQETGYDVVIADLMMPGISGMDLLKSLKENKPEICVIMITGFPSIKTAVEAVKLGAFDYLPKPFTPDELRSVVKRALERKHMSEQLEVDALQPPEAKPHSLSIPRDYYCIPEHSWVYVESDGTVTIGIHHIFLATIKSITSITFPSINDYINQGEACLKITDSNMFIHKLWAPISGKIIAINEQLQSSFAELLKDPYGKGWIMKATPLALEEDLKNLCKNI